MDLKTQRRLAASILKTGEGRIWFDPEDMESISAAVTRDDIKNLILSGAIQARQKRGTSRYRAKKIALQKSKGRKTGHGRRRGTKNARNPRKKAWISTIQGIRTKLTELRKSGEIDVKTYRRLYRMAKGGTFKSKSHLETYIKEKR
ncbi:MAG: 50S ribosomal protein L19e [Candidatus Hydrothermarchaeaceae archaeon]